MKTRIICTALLAILFISSCGEKKASNGSKSTEPIVRPNTKSETEEEETTTYQTALSPEERLGKRLFLLCTACHNLKAGEPHKVGPNLHGVFGSKAGLKDDFVYSDAMKASTVIWDDEAMKAWLENPTAYMPGTNMAFIGLAKEKQQEALIAYLKVETK